MPYSGHLVHFKLNRKTIREIAVSPQVHEMLTEHIDFAKTFAETLASGLRSDEEHQHYQDSFTTEVAKVHGFPREHPMTRWGAKLSNSSAQANFVEFGTVRTTKSGDVVETPGHHILGHTVDFLNTLAPRLDPE